MRQSLTSNLDLVVSGSVPQVSQTEDGIVVLLLPFLGVGRQDSLRLFLFAQTGVLGTIARSVGLLLGLTLTSLENGLVVVCKRSLKDLSTSGGDEGGPSGVDGELLGGRSLGRGRLGVTRGCGGEGGGEGDNGGHFGFFFDMEIR